MNVFEAMLESAPIRALGWTLLHFVWQGVVLFAVHESLQLALRRQSAALRYAMACLVLFGMLASAGTTLVFELQRASLGAGDVQVQASRPATGALDRSAREGATPPVVASTLSDPHPLDAVVDEPSTGAAPRSTAWTPLQALQARLPHLERWLPWLVSLWFAGVFLLTTRLALAWQEARWLRTRAVRPVGADTEQRVCDLLRRLRISRPVRVLESSLAEVPTVVGWLRPVVLLPAASLTGLPVRHLEALLAHELEHIKRHDYLVNLVQTLVETVLFYHPAVWWVSNRIRSERENCCDDAAVRLCGDAVLYARALTGMEELRRDPAAMSLAMAADGGSLVQRVRRVVGHGGEPGGAGAGVVVVALLIGLSSLVAVSAGRSAETGRRVPVEDHDLSGLDGSLGGRIAGNEDAQPAPQLPRPVSVDPEPDPQPDPQPDPRPDVRPDPRPDPRPQARPDPRPEADATGATTSRTRPAFSLDEIVRLEQANVDTGYYSEMVALFGTLDVDEVIALRNHEVPKRYAEDMLALFRRLDVEELVALRIHDVDVDYVQEMSDAFGSRVDIEEIVVLRQHDVDHDDIDEYRRHGHRIDPHEVAALQAMGVDADELRQLEDLGFPNASHEDLVHLAQMGIDAHDLEDLRRELGPFRLEEGAALLMHGVDEGEVEELKEMGMNQPRVDLLLTMYAQGLTADVIDTILDDRMHEVSFDLLVLFKELGLEDVFLPEFRRRNE